MSPTETLLAGWLKKVRAVMYAETIGDLPHEKTAPWFRDLQLLRQALTWPAKECQNRGWQIPAEIFEQLVLKTLQKINANATIPFPQMRRRAAYFFHALQDEFNHNWDQYWDATKHLETKRQNAIRELTDRNYVERTDDTQQVLAQAHALLTNRGGRPKKPRPPKPRQIQSELF